MLASKHLHFEGVKPPPSGLSSQYNGLRFRPEFKTIPPRSFLWAALRRTSPLQVLFKILVDA